MTKLLKKMLRGYKNGLNDASKYQTCKRLKESATICL